MSTKKSDTIDLNFSLWPKQLTAFHCEAQFVLYGGSAGGGKSFIARVCAIHACLSIPGLQVYFFRKHYKELINNHMHGPQGLYALLQPLVSAKICKIKELEIEFANGSRIYLCHLEHDKDVWNYQGQEIHFLILEEATQFSESSIRLLLSRVRIPDSIDIPEQLRSRYPRVLATANPGGKSHDFWKSRFVDQAEFHAGQAWVMNPDDGGRTANFIRASLDDNPSINPEEYRVNLMGLKREDLVEALLHGRWDVPLGAMFPECSEMRHLIPAIPLPDYWFRFRTFDWGSAAPAAVLWWAVADDSIEYISAGTLVCYREWYIASHLDKSKGLGLSNKQMADGIVERTLPGEVIHGTITDSKPFQATGGITIAEEMSRLGVPLQLGSVGRGSRIQGWQQLRSRLIGEEGIPRILFFRNCIETWRTLTQLQSDPHEPEDADTSGDDHAPDAVSLACKARPFVRKKPAEKPLLTIQPTVSALFNNHIKSQRYQSGIRR